MCNDLNLCLHTGISTPRSRGKDGSPLPSPRQISNKLFRAPRECTETDHARTLMVMAWGQFIDHDIVATPMTQVSITIIIFGAFLNNTHSFNVEYANFVLIFLYVESFCIEKQIQNKTVRLQKC